VLGGGAARVVIRVVGGDIRRVGHVARGGELRGGGAVGAAVGEGGGGATRAEAAAAEVWAVWRRRADATDADAWVGVGGVEIRERAGTVVNSLVIRSGQGNDNDNRHLCRRGNYRWSMAANMPGDEIFAPIIPLGGQVGVCGM
jgi:hypothetical protein